MITLDEIARMSRVSKMTASRALNPENEHRVAPRTKERIRKVAKQFNYRPSALVRALQTGQTKMIGFVTESFSSHFFSEILAGVQESMYPLGYDFLSLQWTPDVRNGDRLLQSIADRRLDGVMIAQGDETRDYHYLDELQQHGIPVVAVDREVPIASISFVGSDDFGGAKETTQYLISLGHKKILFLAYDIHTHVSSTRRRIEGYREAMIQNHLAPLPEFVVSPSQPKRDLYRQKIREFLTQPDRPTAIFGLSDYTAGDVIAAAWSAGLKLPEDLSVVGFSDEPLASFLCPTLTTVHQNPREIGKAGAEVMFELIDAKMQGKDLSRIEAHKVYLPTYLVKRQSVMALKAKVHQE